MTQKTKKNRTYKGYTQPFIFFVVVLFIGLFLTVAFLQQPQTFRQFAASGLPNFCSGQVLASDSEFKSQKSVICGIAKSIAVDQVMQSKAGCPTRADAEQAVNDACQIANPAENSCKGEVIASVPYFKDRNKADMCGAFYANVIEGFVKDLDDCNGSKEQAEKAMDEACAIWGVPVSHNETPLPLCSCQMLNGSTEFISNKEPACSFAKNVVADQLYGNKSAGCTSIHQAKQAVEEACAGTCKAVNSVVSSIPTPSSDTATPCVEKETGILGMIKAVLDFIPKFFGLTVKDSSSTTPCK